MAISVLDVRSTFVPPRVAVPSGAAVATPNAPRRLPLPVLAAGVIGVGEALGLLAVGLTGLDTLLTASSRPHGALIATALVALAGWVVASAGSGATMIDGAGRKAFVAVAYLELFAVALLGTAAVVVPLPVPTPEHLPLPALVLLLLAVPVAKLLLAGSVSAQAWIAAGPRIRESRPDPVAKHRLVATLTLAAIGLSLGAVAVGGPQGDGSSGIGAVTAVVSDR